MNNLHIHKEILKEKKFLIVTTSTLIKLTIASLLIFAIVKLLKIQMNPIMWILSIIVLVTVLISYDGQSLIGFIYRMFFYKTNYYTPLYEEFEYDEIINIDNFQLGYETIKYTINNNSIDYIAPLFDIYDDEGYFLKAKKLPIIVKGNIEEPKFYLKCDLNESETQEIQLDACFIKLKKFNHIKAKYEQIEE